MKRDNFRLVATFFDGERQNKGFFTKLGMKQWIRKQRQRDCYAEFFIIRNK